MVARLRGGVGDEIDPATRDLAEGDGSRVVTRWDGEGVRRTRGDTETFLQRSLSAGRRAKDEADPAVVAVEPCADQLAVAETQLLQMKADRAEIFVVELVLQGVKQRREAGRCELPGVRVGDRAQLLEADDSGFELVDRARQNRRRVLRAVSPDPPLVLERTDGDVVHLSDDVRLSDAVRQNLLAVDDGLGFHKGREQDPPRDLEQELVPTRHRVEKGRQLEVLDQVGMVRRQVSPEIEVVSVGEQVRLHATILCRSRS